MRALRFRSRRMGRALVAPIITSSLLTLGGPAAFAADMSEEAFRNELAKRDAVIADLLKRVQELERGAGGASASVRQQPASAPKPRPSARQTAQTDAPSEQGRSTGPGAVDVDELAAERALERTLTAEGALLLPANTFELQPYFGYARRTTDIPALVSVDGGAVARTLDVRRNEFDFGVRGQLGLPYEMQIELDVPYRVVDQSIVRPVGLNDFGKSSDTGSSFGDVKVGIAKTLVRERGWLPDLVGRVTWDTDTGSRVDNDVSLGGIGFNEIRASLTALKRQDPLAFTATLSYENTFEKDGIKPGNALGISLGASLAASPETSLSVALAQSFAQELEVNGRNVSGSSQVGSLLLLGASTMLTRQTLLFLTAGVGLTDDVPDYTVNLALPMRF